jgi:hypothetical protein
MSSGPWPRQDVSVVIEKYADAADGTFVALPPVPEDLFAVTHDLRARLLPVYVLGAL